MTGELKIPDEVLKHPAWHRLSDQRKWYSRKSAENKEKYHRLKIVQIVLAGFIPIISLFEFSITRYVVAVCGAAIAALEGIQHLFQYNALWFNYRSTSEKLKHEQSLFLSLSGPYRGLTYEDGLLCLAERIEECISTEHAKWVDTSNKSSAEMKQHIKAQ